MSTRVSGWRSGREQGSARSLPSSGLRLFALRSQPTIRLRGISLSSGPQGSRLLRSRCSWTLSTGTGARGAGRPQAGGGRGAGSSICPRTLVPEGAVHSLPAYPGSRAQPPEGLQACLAARGPYMVGDDGYCISGSARPSSHPSEHLWLLELVRDGWLTVFTCGSWGTVASANLAVHGTLEALSLLPSFPQGFLPPYEQCDPPRPLADGRLVYPARPARLPKAPGPPPALGRGRTGGERGPSTVSSGVLEGQFSH